jgi:citrate synthase
MTHVGSSLVDPYSAIEKIGKKENVPQFIEDVKARKTLLFGFGHRVYRETDPRSKVIRQVADEVHNPANST